MKLSHLFIGFLLISFWGCSQKNDRIVHTPIQDSIQKYLALANLDSLDYHKRVAYNDKALSFIDLTKNDSLIRLSIFKICSNYCKLEKTDNLENLSNELIKKSLTSNDSINLARGYHSLAYSLMIQSRNESAIHYYFKAMKILETKKRSKEIIHLLKNIAITQSYSGDFLGSIKTSFKAIAIAQKIKLKHELVGLYTNIGNNFSYLRNNHEAIKYYSKANEINKNINIKHSLNTNIANSYFDLGSLDSAFLYVKKNLNEKNKAAINKRNVGITYSQLGLYYLKTKQLQKSYKYLFKADSIFKNENPLNGKNYNHLYISDFFALLKIDSLSIKHAEIAYSISKEYRNPSDMLLSLEQLIKVDPKKASTYSQKYISLNDSLQMSERRFRDKFAQIEYETEEIKQQKNTALKQRTVVFIVASSLLIITLLLFVIGRQRLKQKELRLVQVQQKANAEIYHLMLLQKDKEEVARESERKRISMELHDSVMNKLSSIRLHLSVIKRQRNAKTVDTLDKQVENLFKVETEIRNITHNLNEKGLDQNFHFIKIVDDFIQSQNNLHQIQFSLFVDHTLNQHNLSYVKKMNLLRIIQEACHNIQKHSQANLATITIKKEANCILTIISDNGKGFDPSKTNEGIGLQNIRIRIASLNGLLTINSQENIGSTLTITIPLH